MNRADTTGMRLRWALVGVIAGAAGLLAATPVLPGVVVGILLAVFILAGPGSVLVSIVVLPRVVALITVPATGVAVWLLVATGMAAFELWHTRAALLALAGVTAAAALVRLLLLRRRVTA